jgi:membrane-associated phospholipid phosphatase
MIARWTGWDRLGRTGRLLHAGIVVLGVALVCMATVDKPVARYMHAQVSGDAYAIWAQITRLGDATGYVIAALLVALTGWLGRRVLAPSRLRDRVMMAGRYALLMIAALAASGAVVNVTKVVLGRLRPAYLIGQDTAGFTFFHFDFGANTFPSGHAQAIFAVATTLCLAWPRARIPLVIVAVCVAASRVILADHFVSDVLVGAYLGIASVILLKPIIVDRDRRPPGARRRPIRDRLPRTRAAVQRQLILATLGLAVASILVPWVDLWLMQAVHLSDGAFWLRGSAISDAYDAASDEVFLGIALIVLALTVLAALGRPAPGFGWRRLAVIWTTVVGWVGLVANLLFKNQFGRPRPKNIEAFGGDLPFHPPWLPGGACAHNCSFPSGDAAYAAIALAFAMAAPAGRWRTAAVAAALAFTGFVGAMRVLTGDHFPSDAAFGALISIILVLVLDDRLVRHHVSRSCNARDTMVSRKPHTLRSETTGRP